MERFGRVWIENHTFSSFPSLKRSAKTLDAHPAEQIQDTQDTQDTVSTASQPAIMGIAKH